MAERKKYISVEIPSLESSFRILGTAEELHNKTIKLDMSRKLRGKGLMITFTIFNEGGKLIAIPKKLELTKSYIRKMMRKRVDYVEDSFKAKCSDIRATVKPFLITRKRVSRAVRKNLRNTAKLFIVDFLKERNYNEASEDIFNGTLQKAMLPKLKKVYPLSFCEIRIFETKELEKIDREEIKENAKKLVIQDDMQAVDVVQETAVDSSDDLEVDDQEVLGEVKEEAKEDDSANTSSD